VSVRNGYESYLVNDQIEEAYNKQAEKIAYVAENASGYTSDNEGFNNE
jgi:hypothetical protein